MLDVITIGTATRDVFLQSKQFKTLTDSARLRKLGFKTGAAECVPLGSKVEVENAVYAIGGGAANAAVTFARMGMRTAALVKVGDDEIGNDIETVLQREKVNLIKRASPGQSAYSTILIAPSGERTVLVFRGVSDDWSEKDVAGIPQARWAYLAPGAMPLPVLWKTVRNLKRSGTKIAMNPSRAHLSGNAKALAPILKLLDAVFVNREEASLLTGVPFSDTHGMFRKFDALVPGCAVMTDGAKGAFASDGKTLYRVGIFKNTRVVDRTGAGDAFGSGFIAGLSIGKDVPEALRIGSANATSVVETIGAQKGILSKTGLREKRWQGLAVRKEKLR